MYEACMMDGKSSVNTMGGTHSLHLKRCFVRAGEASGIPSVAVKCGELWRNTSGEGGLLDSN